MSATDKSNIEFEEFLHKVVNIRTKDGLFFQGEVMNLSEMFLTLDDRKVGTIKIAYGEISLIAVGGRV